MPDNSLLPSRKSDHIKINLGEDVQSDLSSGFENFHFVHNAIPEINLADVDSSITLFGKKISAPILISSMTGGTPEAELINHSLAGAAQVYSLAMGVGSQRAAIENPDLAYSFQVRKVAPDILLFANLGAVQLNHSYSIQHCMKAVEMIEADGLFLHLNALQEALQPEGDTKFNELLQKIEVICEQLPVPVIVKEVGWGISGTVARQLRDAGVMAIDVAGAGGTSWSQVEYYRIQDDIDKRIALDFKDWGIPTAECLEQIATETLEMITFASGGIKNGLEIAKAVNLGASLCGIAGPFIRAASESDEAVAKLIEYLIKELHITQFATGCKTLEDVRERKMFKKGECTR